MRQKLTAVFIVFLTLSVSGIGKEHKLFRAIKDGKVEKVKQMIRKKPELLKLRTNFLGRPVLYYTIEENQPKELVVFLIEMGADVNAADRSGDSPLYEACGHKDGYEIARLLIKNGADVNAKSDSGSTPLHAATIHSFNITKLLVEKGADINARTKDGDSPIFWCLGGGRKTEDRVKSAIYLIDKGADLTFKDKEGKSVFDEALENGYTEVVKHMESLTGSKPAFTITKDTLFDKAYKTDLVKKALDSGFSPDVTHEDKGPLLIHAAGRGNLKTVKLLLERGAKPDIKMEGSGMQAIHLAAKGGRHEIIQLLLDRGVSVNQKDGFRGTPLHEAAEIGREETVKFLLEKGADVHARKVIPPFYLPVYEQFTRTKKKTVRLSTAIPDSIKKGKKITDKEMDTLLDQLMVNTDKEYTPIFVAVMYSGDIPTVEALLEKGAKLGEVDVSGYSMMHWLVARNNAELAAFLVKKGAPWNLKDKRGETPLQLAKRIKNKEMVKFLTGLTKKK